MLKYVPNAGVGRDDADMRTVRWITGFVLAFGPQGIDSHTRPTSASNAESPPTAAAATTASPFAPSEPIPRRPETLRLATYDLGRTLMPAASDADTEPALQTLAQTLRRIDADLVALQNVPSRDALIAFRDRYLQGMGYDHVVQLEVGEERARWATGEVGGGIGENAVLSRWQVVSSEVWPSMELGRGPANGGLGARHPETWGQERNWRAGQPIRFFRSPLRVTVRRPPTRERMAPAASAAALSPWDLTIFVVFHKAGAPGGYWRDAEAEGVAALVRAAEEKNPAARIAVLGDFNATPDERSLQIYRGEDAAPGKSGLRDVSGDRPAADPAWPTHRSGRTLDAILINRALAPNVVPGSRFVLHTPVPAPPGPEKTPPPPGPMPDHYPVMVDLSLPEGS
jgi:endonuclease/exonuclease/phosphatase family metal-dependent hydrolase